VAFRAAVPSVTDKAIQRLSRNARVARGRPWSATAAWPNGVGEVTPPVPLCHPILTSSSE